MPFSAFHGIITAVITPFADGKIDDKRFQTFLQWQIDQGVHGIVAAGTTGEAPTLSDEEMRRVVQLAVEVANGRVPVIAGCGSNNTAHAIHLTQIAGKGGANAALHVPPYYNKPTQEGMFQHFKAIHDNTGLPIFLYNVPGRTVTAINPDTMARIAEMPRIAGVKDWSGDITRPAKTRATCKSEFQQLTGDDPVTLPFLAMGGKGCISVTSNIAPALCAEVYNAWMRGDLAKAQKINDQLMPLHDAMFCETSPGPVKYAASILGHCRYEYRLPLVPISKTSEKIVEGSSQEASAC